MFLINRNENKNNKNLFHIQQWLRQLYSTRSNNRLFSAIFPESHIRLSVVDKETKQKHIVVQTMVEFHEKERRKERERKSN